MKTHGKTVALVDPLWIGHHPMYFSQFSASFLRSGVRVIGLCPEPEAAFENLCQTLGPDEVSGLESKVYFHHLPAGKRSFFNGRFEGDPVRTFGRWKLAADTLADAEATCGMRADLVYFPYLDSFLRFLPFASVPKLVLNRPWSGLYLRNHHHGEPPSPAKSLRCFAKGDALLRSELCRGVGVLDERFIPAMERFTGKRVVPFPDVTQAGLPATPYSVASAIQRKAAGRKIIGMIGLEKRKGFLTLVRTAKLAREQGLPYYFAGGGVIHFGQYTSAEQAELHELLDGISASEIDNIYFDPTMGRIPSEEDYNCLFASFDIAWAAYEGFKGSSGTLSKAAAFEIPCLATAGECVGDRVEKYRLGLTIPEGSPEHALEAIKRLAQGIDEQDKPLDPRFEEFREFHSLAHLDRILGELVESVP